jgi:EthD domain
MITRVFLAPRRQDMTTEACLNHWRGHHAAIGASLPHVRAYVQNHGVLDGGRFLLPYPGFEIMPELDWDDLASMDAAIDSPAHEEDSVGDEANFIDTSRTGLAVTERHVLIDGAPAPGGVKLITLLRRAPGASEKDFQDAVLGGYGHAVAEARTLRHEVLITLPDRPGRPPFTAQAIDLLWFDSPREALAWTASEGANRAAWQLAGRAFGSERLIARPYKVV